MGIRHDTDSLGYFFGTPEFVHLFGIFLTFTCTSHLFYEIKEASWYFFSVHGIIICDFCTR